MRPDRRPCVCRGYLEVTDPRDRGEVAAVVANHNATPLHEEWRARREQPPIPDVIRLTPELQRELAGTRPRSPSAARQWSGVVGETLTRLDPETIPESELRALDGNR